ncbi:MAG: AraC family transcriptional regulator [Planctomycetota bacterium]
MTARPHPRRPDGPPTAAFVGELQRRVQVPGVMLADVRDDPRVPVGRHTHAEAQFCVLLSDGYRSSARDAPYACGRGTLLYHPAGTTHDDRYLRRGGRFLTVTANPGAGGGLAKLPALPSASCAFVGPRTEILCEKLALESGRQDASAPLALECLVLEMVGLVVSEPPERRCPSWLRRVLERVLEQPDSPTVAELAAEAGVHPVSLARAFRRHVGMTPGEVRRWARLRRVLPALSGRSDSLARLALEAGFSDQTSFTRACRRVLGVPPGRYRAWTRSTSRG